MYKLLIVDDEEIEREGMEKFVQWDKYGIELVGSAWNGVEGFEKIRKEKPDIVLTDIKMPVMNGIELIRKTRRNFPEIEFVVLSGYREYEFTSQAMEEGVRHYLLKPCDEQKIASVLDKVKTELEEKRKRKDENQYQKDVLKLLPRAKEQIFRNMLLGREQFTKDYQLLLDAIGKGRKVVVLAFRIQKGFDNLEQFVIGNILSDLLGKEKVLLSAAVENEVLLLVDADACANVEAAVARTRKEFTELEPFPIQAAVSREGIPEQVSRMYAQVQGLFRLGDIERQIGFLHEGLFRDIQNNAVLLVDYQRIRNANGYEDILFEIYLSFAKMELRQYTLQQEEEVMHWVLYILYDGNKIPECAEKENRWGLFEQVTDQVVEKQGMAPGPGKDGQRIRRVMLSIYRNIRNPDLNIHYLSRKVLYMNEDYFGRLFIKTQKARFSAFLAKRRITLAQRLLQYEPELKFSQLAELVGYPSDGQYFSKEFRKVAGMSPTEYRDSLKKK
jgi:two-component system response regulator YesN